jgi:hypothetical protein
MTGVRKKRRESAQNGFGLIGISEADSGLNSGWSALSRKYQDIG